jgi:hypothetical protein
MYIIFCNTQSRCLHYIVIKLVYSLIVRGWHNRSHFPIDTLHGNKYSLTTLSSISPDFVIKITAQ